MTEEEYVAAVDKINEVIGKINDKNVEAVFDAVTDVWCDNEDYIMENVIAD